jgi:hypothetical protein
MWWREARLGVGFLVPNDKQTPRMVPISNSARSSAKHRLRFTVASPMLRRAGRHQ